MASVLRIHLVHTATAQLDGGNRTAEGFLDVIYESMLSGLKAFVQRPHRCGIRCAKKNLALACAVMERKLPTAIVFVCKKKNKDMKIVVALTTWKVRNCDDCSPWRPH